MSPYQHIVVVMSILLGLAVTQLLGGIAQLYRGRKRARPYWLHSAWAVLLVVFSFLLWWTYWNYRDVENWTFVRFVLYLSPTVAFSLVTLIAFPDPADPVVDLKQYYFANRVGFFGSFALYVALAGLAAMVVRGLPVLDASNAIRLATVLLLLALTRSASERVHALVFVISGVLMLLFVVLFQYRLT